MRTKPPQQHYMCDCPLGTCAGSIKTDQHGNQFCRDERDRSMMAYVQSGLTESPTDAVVEAVRADLLRRQQHGYLKYGGTLATNPAGLRGALQHAYEESLDLCNYLKWSLMQLDASPELKPDAGHATGLKSTVRRCQGAPTRPDGSCWACWAASGQECLSPAATDGG